MEINFEKYKISAEIIKALTALGYTKPTEVQERVISEALFNKDLIVQSQTGSGKTASFVIPLCEKAVWEENEPIALILSPTRELAIQISEEVKNIGRYKRIKSIAVYGKGPFKDQARELKGKVHMVIGTPGRVLDHIDRKTLSVNNIKYLIIDEADEMLNMGFIRQVEGVMRRIPKKRTTMLFSATLEEEIMELCSKYMNRPVEIKIKGQNVVKNNIEHVLYKIKGEEKLNYLSNLLIKEKPDRGILFCRTKDNVDLAYKALKAKGYSVDKIHGGMMQKERLNAMNSFKEGKYRLLVSTDIAARGIDVEDISHVINIDIPVEKEAYVHRIGRTARAGKTGKAITFMTPYEEKYLNSIEEYIELNILELSLDKLVLTNDEIISGEKILRTNNEIKNKKKETINKSITKLYFNGGKKKKIRAVDLVGTISNIAGVIADDIGIIDIQDNGSYVEILNGKGKLVLDSLKEKTIKGKKLRVEIAKNK